MSLKILLFVTFSLFLFQHSAAQRNYQYYNRLGFQGGFTLFDISTSDLNTKQGTGFIFGFTTRGSFYNKFDLIYGINFLNNKIEILGRNPENSSETQDIDYTIQGAQVTFIGSYNIVRHHLSIEAGPILNINGKMKLDSNKFEEYILDGYNELKAEEIQDISKINFHLAGGITAGLENFRISAQYQYGVTNMLNKLNDKNLENSNFKGNSTTIVLLAVMYF